MLESKDCALPRIWVMARRRAACEVAAIRSAEASACIRVIRPLATARRENSPGPAGRAPESVRVWSTLRAMSGEPCMPNSTMSSPVNVRGARNMVATAWSMGRVSGVLPCGIMYPRCAVWEGHEERGFPFQCRSAMRRASGPLRRISIIAPWPGGVATAAIVSLVIGGSSR